MRTPSHEAVLFAKSISDAAYELQFFHRITGEMSSLEQGQRVYFTTIEGEFSGVVQEDWEHGSGTGWPAKTVSVTLDCEPEKPFSFHRSLFRAFTVLDHLALL